MSEGTVSRVPVWGIPRADPGYLYIVGDNGRLKVGKSGGRDARMRAARTWLPDMHIIGVKPFWNVSTLERDLHQGIAPWWYHGEWFHPGDDPYLQTFLDDFRAFRDGEEHRDANSIDFIYWMHDFMEFAMERASRGQSLRAFQRDISEVARDRG